MKDFVNVANSVAYFSNRDGGVSKPPYESLNIALHVDDNPMSVLENRELLTQKINQDSQVIDHRQWIFLNQTHEPNIFMVDEQQYDPINLPAADASITKQRNLPLVIMTADCGPLVISGESVLGTVHASWRTVASGLIEKTIDEMKSLAPGEKFRAFLGPCIHPQSYEFEPNLLSELSNKLGGHVVSKTLDSRPAFDLPASINFACESADVVCESSGVDTFSSAKHFSYRRDGVTGRQGVVSWLK